MKYTVTKAPQGGYAIEKQSDRWADKELDAVALDMTGVGDYFRGPQSTVVISRPGALRTARALVACFSDDQDIRKRITCIKLVREASGAGLKEAKEAVEQAIEERWG